MNEEKTHTEVVLTDVDIPFGKLVGLMIKVALASIPAAIILSLLGLLITVAFSFVLAGCGTILGY